MISKVFKLLMLLAGIWWIGSGAYYSWIKDYDQATLSLLWYIITWIGVKENE